jgi:hypothetical protein
MALMPLSATITCAVTDGNKMARSDVYPSPKRKWR